jgi:hypothetical protein
MIKISRVFFVSLLFLGTACDSGNQTFEPDAAAAVDGGLTEQSCEAEGGVSVSGELRFAGQVPEGAKLYIFWQTPTPSIPPCSMEITPVSFPASFRFTGVPGDQGWHMEALLDVDGGFPPLPEVGDFVDVVDASDLDLTGDLTGVVLELTEKTE